MTYIGTIQPKDVGGAIIRLDGRSHYLHQIVEPKHVGRYVWLRRTDEGTVYEIETDEQYAKRIKAANRRHRGG